MQWAAECHDSTDPEVCSPGGGIFDAEVISRGDADSWLRDCSGGVAAAVRSDETAETEVLLNDDIWLIVSILPYPL
jgi:hypothetical protein